mmetsp:Transcript_36771/g.82857  ORF Transcript_36771/g.82857 Transcript_36771/m.82857 type:complete len:224 (-) Transcript_36771:480-1151(-)
MESYTKPSEFEHGDIVGTIAYCNDLLERQALLLCDLLQELCLPVAVDDLSLHLSCEFSILEVQLVGVHIVNPQFLLQGASKVREAPGQDSNLVAQPLEVCDQSRSSFGDGKSFGDVLQDVLVHALEESHAPLEAFLEVQLPAHGCFCDFCYLLSNIRLLCQLINDFALYQSRVHVEKDQAPVSSVEIIVLYSDVDRLVERDLEEFFSHLVHIARFSANFKLKC